MKTALYTIFRCTNYGAVLQAVALRRVLDGLLGSDSVDVINHRMDPRDTHLLGKVTNPNTPWISRWLNRRKFARRDWRPDLFEERRRRTIDLIAREIRPTERLYEHPRKLRKLPPYATVVVGSDQVWSPTLNNDFGRNPYLAKSLPSKQDRVAYAASFGVGELPSDCRSAYASALSRFRAITVCEESGADICEALTGRRPDVVLDPTLLLSAGDWSEAVCAAGADADQALVAYWVRRPSAADVSALAAVARVCELPLRLLSAGPLPRIEFPPEVVPVVNADPFDFVTEIACAAGVLTDSYHGLLFSTLFRRPFLALADLSEPKANAVRLADFCRRYGIGGAVHDLVTFRCGERPDFEDFAMFDDAQFDADRARSLATLEGLVRP